MAQTLTNGNFNAGAAGWACNAEVGFENVYGGPTNSNRIAEVDIQAGLC